jgi:hypothetical protein
LGLPKPLPRRRVCPPPPPPVLGGGAHSLAREGLGESQFRREDIHCGTLYIYVLCVLNTLTYVSAVCSEIIRRLGKDLFHVLQSQGRPLTLQKYLRPVQLECIKIRLCRLYSVHTAVRSFGQKTISVAPIYWCNYASSTNILVQINGQN